MKSKAISCLIALMLCMGVFGATAYASADNETMIVNASWMDGELLRVDVTDKQTGNKSSLAIRLTDYISETENSEYITIHTMDSDGNKVGVIEVKNPYYKPPAVTSSKGSGSNIEPEVSTEVIPESQDTDSTAQSPFTPDGSGTVMDNVTENEGKEFFTISTEDNNVFYLVVDRQRNSENVYLLNAVTENDLMSLAQKGNGGVSAIPTPEPLPTPEPETEQEAEIEKPATGNNTGSLIIPIIVMLAAGGAGYYFKIVKPKKERSDFDDDEEADTERGEFDEGDEFDETEESDEHSSPDEKE